MLFYGSRVLEEERMKNRIINYALDAIALISTALAMPHLPERVAMHFDASGAADRYGSKYELFVLPIVLIILNVVLELRVVKGALSVDADTREAQSAKNNAKVGSITVTAVSLVFVIMNFGLLYLGFISADSVDMIPFDFIGLVCVALGLAIMVMGNYMPKTKENSFIGFRCGWTRYNDVTWQKSNRFMAYAMMISGAVSILGGLIFGGMTSAIILFTSLTASLAASLIYAYVIYKREKGNEN